MSFEAALVFAAVILLLTIVAMTILIASRRRDAQEEELKQAASARGWTFASGREGGYRVHRWTGTTNGMSWQAEDLRDVSGGNKRHHRRRQIARWHGAWSPGINGAIVAMGVPKGKEVTGAPIATDESWVARLAQKTTGVVFDQTVDAYFGHAIGKDIDAGAMQRVDGQNAPGFIIMAADKEEGARILSQGFETAIVIASNDTASVLANEDRPWLLLRPSGISLARMSRFRDIKEVDGFVRAGVALTRAFKFGRLSA